MDKKIKDIFLFIAHKIEGIGAPDQPTIFGITQNNYPKMYNKLKSLVDTQANKNLIDLAIIDSYTELAKEYKANRLFFPLGIWYFDHAFNAGIKSAVIILQKCLNLNGADLKVDGIWGKHTQKAYDDFVKNAYVEELNKFENQYLILRRWLYTHLRSFEYRCGWINRTLRLEMFVRYGIKDFK